MTRTPSLLLAASVLSAFALSGCGDGTVRTGAAATIGNDRITTTTLDGYVTRALKDTAAQQKVGTDKAGFERDVLGRILQHDIVTTAAKQQGVTVDGADVDAYVTNLDQRVVQSGQGASLEAAAAGAGIAKQDQRQFFTDLVLKEAIADKLTASIDVPLKVLQDAYQQNIATYDQVHSAHILVASKALADTILKQVKADPTTFAALAAKYSTDTGSKANGGDLGFQGKGALVKEFEAAIFANKPGSFVEVKTQFGYHVIHVIERRTTTFAQAQRDLRRGLLQTQRDAKLSAYLQKVAKDLGVHVNPRFGVWDTVGQSVVAPAVCPSTAFSSPSPRAADAAAATPTPTATPSCK
ncbi:MAG: peptidylprolyl isomerase [Frankiales bacterium]|nr:peptidylprolyl isomerase [Frankiales bacterium]